MTPRKDRSPRTIYMSTSTLENAVETLLNAGCFEKEEDARETAARHFELVFRIQVSAADLVRGK